MSIHTQNEVHTWKMKSQNAETELKASMEKSQQQSTKIQQMSVSCYKYAKKISWV